MPFAIPGKFGPYEILAPSVKGAVSEDHIEEKPHGELRAGVRCEHLQA
jgi:hypothetical protein